MEVKHSLDVVLHGQDCGRFVNILRDEWGVTHTPDNVAWDDQTSTADVGDHDGRKSTDWSSLGCDSVGSRQNTVPLHSQKLCELIVTSNSWGQ